MQSRKSRHHVSFYLFLRLHLPSLSLMLHLRYSRIFKATSHLLSSPVLSSLFISPHHVTSLLSFAHLFPHHVITSHQLLSCHLSSPLISPLIFPSLSTSILTCARDDLLWTLEGKMPSQRLHQMHFDVRSAATRECTYSINVGLPCISMPLHCLPLILPNNHSNFS
jgi:hypothetical protein